MTVSRETQMQRYRQLLQRWGSALNLSSALDSGPEGIEAHIEDSLTIIPFLPTALSRLIDLGSGQGFPAIPIAIETGIAVNLIEADKRKGAFLTTALATLGLRGHVLTTRIEATTLAPARCVTAKALAPLGRLLALARPFVAPDGCCLFLKGPAAQQEVSEAASSASFRAEIIPMAERRSNLVRITGLR